MDEDLLDDLAKVFDKHNIIWEEIEHRIVSTEYKDDCIRFSTVISVPFKRKITKNE